MRFFFFLVLCAVTALDVHQREYVIELHDSQDPQRFAEEHHLQLVGPLSSLGALRHFYRFTTTRMTQLRALDQRLKDASGVRFVEEQQTRLRYKRNQAPSDPLYGNQWHLHNSDTASTKGAGVRIQGAWDMGFTGKGVVIGVVDDGLQHSHPDLHDRYRADLSHNYNGGNHNDPMPSVTNGDNHGTSAAGTSFCVFTCHPAA